MRAAETTISGIAPALRGGAMSLRLLTFAGCCVCAVSLHAVAAAQAAGGMGPPPEAEITEEPEAEGPANGATNPAHPGEALGETELAAEEKKTTVPWMAAFSWSHGFYAKGFGGYLSNDPEYYWGFLVTLGWKFSQATALTFNEYGTIELTQSDSTVTNHQFAFFNPTLDLSHKLSFEPTSGQTLDLKGAAGVLFPTGASTQASTFVVGTTNFGLRGRVGATYTWKHVFHGLDVSPGFGYQYRFANSNTVPTETTFPCSPAGVDASQDCRFLGSETTTRDVLIAGVESNAALGDKWVAGLSLNFFFTHGRDLAPATVPTDTGKYTLLDMSTTHWRNLRWFATSLGYRLTNWFTLSGRISDVFGERGPNGKLRGLFNPLDMILGIDLDLSIDELYTSLHSHGAAAH